MENPFRHYCPYTIEEIDEIWENGLFVIDTNVLLHIYRYFPRLRDDFFGILEAPQIKSRIFTPFQIAEEFHKDRASVICDQISISQKVESILEKQFRCLEQDLVKAFSHKHHPFISKDDLVATLKTSCSKTLDEIETKKKDYPSLVSHDDYLKRMQAIIMSTL
jgi:hypothetical protein